MITALVWLFVAVCVGDPSMTSELVTEHGLLPDCSRQGINICQFTLQTDEVVVTVGCDLKLYSDTGPYQDPLGDNFAPPGFPNATNCDSFLSAKEGRIGILKDVSFIQWGDTSPFVVSAVLVLDSNYRLEPGSRTLLLQLAFKGPVNETVAKGTFFIIGPGSVYWSAKVVCGQEKSTVVLSTSPAPPPITSTPTPGLSGGIVAVIVIVVLLLAALGVLIVFVAVRFCKRKKKVQYTFDGLDSDLQQDFEAVARAALRGFVELFFLLLVVLSQENGGQVNDFATPKMYSVRVLIGE